MQKKQLSVLVLIILCFLLGCNRETPKDESQQNYEDESMNIQFHLFLRETMNIL